MDLLQAVVLGVIQGLTEFLPVSSSGHLVIAQHLFGLREPEILFDVGVHLGTLVAVLLYFRGEIGDILAAVVRCGGKLFNVSAMRAAMGRDADLKMAWLIVIGSVPTAVIGLLMQRVADRLFGSMLLAGCMLLVTGVLLFLTRFVSAPGSTDGAEPLFSSPKALIIGTVQGLAILPGISRSGSTIAAALFLGLNRDVAARYSFLLSISAILGAALLTLKEDVTAQTASQLPVLLAGALTSCVVGYLSLKFLVYIVSRGSLHLFAPYAWIMGTLAVIIGW